MRPNSARPSRPTADKGSRVQVAVRIRPVNRSDCGDERVVVRSDAAIPRTVVVEDANGRRSRTFEYDFVFQGDQQEVFDNLGAPMLDEVYKGFNTCLFAYGQTGSGKTHSLLGDVDGNEAAEGLLPRFVRNMFREAQKRVEEDSDVTIKVTMSMIEIYMEKVRDLLAPRVRGQEPESLEIHEDQNRKVYVRNVGVHSVLSFDRVMELLRIGASNRQSAETKMNEVSSRSHSVVQFTVCQMFESAERRDIESTVSLVDLAGSERQSKTDTSGLQFEEAKKINQSLLMLGRALNSFNDSRGDVFVSLRESKLTRLLSESFGGNSKTWMLATVSPAGFNLTETLSTLEYAQNALCITNKAHVNRKEKLIDASELKDMIVRLEHRLDTAIRRLSDVEMTTKLLREEESKLLEMIALSARATETESATGKAVSDIQAANKCLRDEIRMLEQSQKQNGQEPALIGRCGVSLGAVFRGERQAVSLPIVDVKDGGGVLHLQLFPVCSPTMSNGDQLIGSSVRFCLNIVGATDLPIGQCFCKCKLRFDQDDRSFQTSLSPVTTAPVWNFVKRFDLLDLTREVVECFTSEDVFTFEVYVM